MQCMASGWVEAAAVVSVLETLGVVLSRCVGCGSLLLLLAGVTRPGFTPMLQVPPGLYNRVELLDGRDMHLGRTFQCCIFVDPQKRHTFQSVLRVDCSAMADNDRDKFDAVRGSEPCYEPLVLLMTMRQLGVRVRTSTGFELEEEQGWSLVYTV